jgi:hypothetical protein
VVTPQLWRVSQNVSTVSSRSQHPNLGSAWVDAGAGEVDPSAGAGICERGYAVAVHPFREAGKDCARDEALALWPDEPPAAIATAQMTKGSAISAVRPFTFTMHGPTF